VEVEGEEVEWRFRALSEGLNSCRPKLWLLWATT